MAADNSDAIIAAAAYFIMDDDESENRRMCKKSWCAFRVEPVFLFRPEVPWDDHPFPHPS
jgi:hypothetical protein